MDAENVNDRQPFNRLNFALVFRQSWPGPSQKLSERVDPAESSVTALEQLGEVCPTATVSAPEAHATTEGTLTAPSFIGISGSPPLTQSSAAPQGDRTRSTTASELHVVPPPPPSRQASIMASIRPLFWDQGDYQGDLSVQLGGHPDRQTVDYVLNGLRNGFRLGFNSNSTKLKSVKANGLSALKHASVIDNYPAKEVSLGRVFRPTSIPPTNNLQVNLFGVIPKKDGEWRLIILDLSFPFGHNVNDGINKDEFTLTYSKVSDAISLIIKARRGALMGKVDIESAYRIIPVHPSDRHLLGMF